MATMTTSSTPATTSRFRAGLAISALLGLLNIGFVLVPTPDGQDNPPVAVIVGSALIGLVSVVCAAVAWRSGNRLAVRINAAALIVDALLTMPAFFVDIDAWIKAVGALAIVLTVAALVLTLRREPTPFTVTD
jgi:peptidoglycan/LPS O-acetylase OafA/YrhL